MCAYPCQPLQAHSRCFQLYFMRFCPLLPGGKPPAEQEQQHDATLASSNGSLPRHQGSRLGLGQGRTSSMSPARTLDVATSAASSPSAAAGVAGAVSAGGRNSSRDLAGMSLASDRRSAAQPRCTVNS